MPCPGLAVTPGPWIQAHISPNRKCKLVTSGPWLEVAPIALGDVSIIPESPDAAGRGHSVALWAVSDKGDVLCRLGVSELNPAGSSWLHVGTDQPFSSVSIGACYQVWAVARDGSAFYRGSVSPSKPAGEWHLPSPSTPAALPHTTHTCGPTVVEYGKEASC